MNHRKHRANAGDKVSYRPGGSEGWTSISIALLTARTGLPGVAWIGITRRSDLSEVKDAM